MQTCAIILAGGRGTRFWPWSTDLMPKQFLPLAHPEKSLLQQAVERIRPLTERILVLTNTEFVPLVRTQLNDLDPSHVIGEPMIKDTAAAIGLGVEIAGRLWPEAVQYVLPADHEIAPEQRFREVLEFAAECAQDDGKLYTIGIHPSYPTSAYGYLKRARIQVSDRGFMRSQVAAFVEKPDEEMAREYVDSGIYYWNAGIFVWRPDACKAAIASQLPSHAALLPEIAATFNTPEFEKNLRAAFTKLPKISIDYGVMQAEGSAGNVRMVESDFRWSDLGGWTAFADKLPIDGHGNRIYGHGFDWKEQQWQERWSPRQPEQNDPNESLGLGDIYSMKARGNLLFNNHPGHKLAVFGVQDLVVIHTHHNTLIVPRSVADNIKPLIEAMPQETRTGGRVTPRKVEKPWGYELWWGQTDDFVGKTLFLKKDKRFSLQYHTIKEEVIYVHEGKIRLWTAARGEQLEEMTLTPGDAVHVEPGRLHRMLALEDSLLYEVSMAYLWDVVRLADDFGREGTRTIDGKE